MCEIQCLILISCLSLSSLAHVALATNKIKFKFKATESPSGDDLPAPRRPHTRHNTGQAEIAREKEARPLWSTGRWI